MNPSSSTLKFHLSISLELTFAELFFLIATLFKTSDAVVVKLQYDANLLDNALLPLHSIVKS